MRFKVREGFAIHFSRLIDIPGLNGEVVQEVQTSSHYAGQIVEFAPDEVLEHAHKLEPFDKEAKAWLESRAVVVVEPAPAAALDQTALAEAVAKAVALALASMPAPAVSGQLPLDQAGS